MAEKEAPVLRQTKEGLGLLRPASLLPLAATLACLVCTVLVFGMRYELNDDAIISNIAAGAYGPGTQYLVYVNVLFGWLLKPFFALAGGLNWFVLLLLAGAVLCFALFGRVLMIKLGNYGGMAIFLAFLALVGVDFFRSFHYVKYAGLFATAGLLLVVLTLGRWNAAAWCGVALALWGSMLRFRQFVSVGGLAAALLLYLFIKMDRAQKKRAAVTVGSMVLAAFALVGIDRMVYAGNPNWAAYMRYNQLRTEISDYQMQFVHSPEHLAPLGYSTTDYEMLDTWNYYDPEVFSQEALEKIQQALPRNTVAGALKQTVRQLGRVLYHQPVHIMLSAVLLGWVFISGKKRWAALVGTLGMLAAEILFLCWRGRIPDPVLFTLALAALVFCACCYEQPQRLPLRWTLHTAALLLLFAVPAYSNFKNAAKDYWASKPPRAEEFTRLTEDKDILYLADIESVDAANGYDVWHPRPKGYFSNVVFTGSWLNQSPFQQQVLQNFGLQNPYKDSIGREDVVYLDYVYRALKEDYLRQHYNPHTRLVMVEEAVWLHKYRAVEQPPTEQEA